MGKTTIKFLLGDFGDYLVIMASLVYLAVLAIIW
jgi:hypothetical protein